MRRDRRNRARRCRARVQLSLGTTFDQGFSWLLLRCVISVAVVETAKVTFYSRMFRENISWEPGNKSADSEFMLWRCQTSACPQPHSKTWQCLCSISSTTSPDG